MIEIIIREDFNKYEVKPFFGFSLRQIGVFAVCLICGFAIFTGLEKLGVHTVLIGIIICVVSGLIGVGCLKKFQGMYFTKRLPILLKYYRRPEIKFIRSPYFVSSRDTNKKGAKQKMTGKEKRELKRELRKAKKESERISK